MNVPYASWDIRLLAREGRRCCQRRRVSFDGNPSSPCARWLLSRTSCLLLVWTATAMVCACTCCPADAVSCAVGN